MKFLILLIGLFGLNSCLFSGYDQKEVALSGNYYLTFNSYQFSIIMKENDAETDAIVVNVIDSIGLTGHIVAGVSESRYFILDTQINSAPSFFIDYGEFLDVLQKSVKGEIELHATGGFFDRD